MESVRTLDGKRMSSGSAPGPRWVPVLFAVFVLSLFAVCISLVALFSPNASGADLVASNDILKTVSGVYGSVAAASTGPLLNPLNRNERTGASAVTSPQYVDGVQLSIGDSVLIKDELDPRDNGIYDWTETGFQRSANMQSSLQITPGNSILVLGGTVNGGSSYTLLPKNPSGNNSGDATDDVTGAGIVFKNTSALTLGSTAQQPTVGYVATFDPNEPSTIAWVPPSKFQSLSSVTSVSAGSGLTTGAPLNGNPITNQGTLQLASVAPFSFMTNNSNVYSAPTDPVLMELGGLLTRNDDGIICLPQGAEGQVLQISPVGPAWASIGLGSVSNISAGNGGITCSPANITTIGTIGLTPIPASVMGYSGAGSGVPGPIPNLTSGGQLVVSSSTTAVSWLAAGLTGQLLQSAGNSASPSWSTVTFPSATTANQILYSSSNNVVGGLTTSNNAVLTTSSGGVPIFSATLPGSVQNNITSLGVVATGVWHGTNLELAYGGTGASLSGSAGGIVYSNSGSLGILSGTATANRLLLSSALSAPTWSTLTMPSSSVANQLLFSTADNVVAGLPSSNNGVLVTTAFGVPTFGSTLPAVVQSNITGLGTITGGLWRGTPIELAYGGTNANLVASNGGILYSTASAVAILAGTGTANRLLVSGLNAAPSWTSLTFPTASTANQLLYSSATNTVTGLPSANNSVLATDGSGVPSLTATLPSAVQANIVTVGTVSTGVWAATPVALAYGGTNAALVASAGGIFYSTASAGAILAGTATANQLLLSGASAAPTWSTATFPATTAINQILYSSAANVVAGLATANNGVLVTGGTGIPAISSTLPAAVQANITTVGTITTGTWSGSNISMNKGGTNASLTASAGGIFYSTASAGAILSGTATANQLLLSGSSAAPTWSAATYPSSTVINQLLYSSATNTVAGLTTANNSVLATDGTGVPSLAATLPAAVQANITTVGTVTTGTWSATNIALNKGGTNASLTASNGGIFYSTASAGAILAGTATARQLLLSGAAGAPSWSTATFPITTTANQILYSSATNTIAGLPTANSSVVITDGTGVPSLSNTLPAAVQSNITALGTVTTGVWNATAVPLANGGTNAALTASLGGIFYSTATAGAILPGVATANLILMSGLSAAPAWSSATYPSSTNVNEILFSSSANVIGGLPTANNGILITGGTGIPSISGTLPSAVQGNITSVGTIASGTWAATPIALAYGGTNAALTASNGGIFYSTASAGAILAGTATASRVLLSGASSAPAWSTATYPGTVTVNSLLYASALNVVSALATANNSVLATDGSGVPSLSSTLPAAVQANITTVGTVATGTWSATNIALNKGGTNASLTASLGGIFYSTASAGAILSGTATARQLLLSGASAAPTWSSATFPTTTTANQLLYSSATNTVAGLATANNAVVVTDGTGIPSVATTLPSAVQTNITQLGTVTTGTWNATVLGIAYGGTNNSTAYTAGSVIFSNGTSLTQDNSGLYYNSSTKQLVVGSGTTTTSVILDVVSTTAAFRPPSMTTTQMNAIVTPATGSFVYNNTLNTTMSYNGSAWFSDRRLIAYSVVTAGTTFTTAAGVSAIRCVLVGGGAGGGGGTSGGLTAGAGGGGGSGGVCDTGLLTSGVTQSTGYTISIGTGGNGGNAGNNAGQAGTATTMIVNGVTYTANGGSGGSGSPAFGNTVLGGAPGGLGGTALNGLVNTQGGNGGNSFFQGNGAGGASGFGGSNNFGNGAQSVQVTGLATGVSATVGQYGAGGSGGGAYNGNNAGGGAGAPGAIIVFQYS